MAALRDNLRRQRPLREQRVHRHHAAAQVAPGQQPRHGGALAGLRPHGHLPQDAAVRVAHQADQVAGRPVQVRPAHRLAVDGQPAPPGAAASAMGRAATKAATRAASAAQSTARIARRRVAALGSVARRLQLRHQLLSPLAHPAHRPPPCCAPRSPTPAPPASAAAPRGGALAPRAARVGHLRQQRSQIALLPRSIGRLSRSHVGPCCPGVYQWTSL
ncbi:MAG: hypothetical protein U0232_32350 [Thermomicrobiales bacterium]